MTERDHTTGSVSAIETQSRYGDARPFEALAPEEIPIRFDETWFSYDSEPVVRDINFSITRGEFAAILGPNGSGKTAATPDLSLTQIHPSS